MFYIKFMQKHRKCGFLFWTGLTDDTERFSGKLESSPPSSVTTTTTCSPDPHHVLHPEYHDCHHLLLNHSHTTLRYLFIQEKDEVTCKYNNSWSEGVGESRVMVWGCSDNHHSVSEWLSVNPQTKPVRRNRCLQKLQNIKNLELSEHRTEFCLQALICWCSDLGSGICNLPGCKERPLNSSHTLWWWRTRTEPDRRTLEGTWT